MAEASFARMTVEFPDGRVVSAMVDAAELHLNELYQDPWMLASIGPSPFKETIDARRFGNVSWRAVLSGRMMQISFMDRDTAKETLAQKKTTSEWRCDFCGAVMKREHAQCSQCAAWRSFLYD